jgi:Ca2+-binding EF-hand superfamily protein
LKLTRNVEILNLEENPNQSEMIESRRRSSYLKSLNSTSLTGKNVNYSQILTARLEKSKDEAKSRRLSSRPDTPMKDLRSIKDRNYFKKDLNDLKVKTIFMKISGAANTVNNSNFLEFLRIRYPGLLADAIARHFDFQFDSYGDYLVKMNRFISSSDKQHLKFCFDLFDLNRDGFICYQDTFKALEIRKQNLYDEDFIVLQELLQLKFEGKLVVSKKRRKSTFGMIRERIEKRIRSRLPIPPVVKDLTTKINFAEFKLAKFLNKPQVLRDFLKYVCGFNYSKIVKRAGFKGKHVKKDSENIVIDMNIDQNYRTLLEKDPKFLYYCELDEIMAKYDENNLKVQLEKFKFLQSSQKFMYRVISKESMVEKFVSFSQPKLIGFNSEYFSKRVFDFLSKGQYLTKARFLTSILPYQKSQSSVEINNLAFNLIDYRQDGKITVDEITSLFHCLPNGCPAYNESLK